MTDAIILLFILLVCGVSAGTALLVFILYLIFID